MRITAIVIIVLMLLPPLGALAGNGAPEKPGKKDKCPVCGMFVYKYPDWVAAVVLPGGRTLYFDGAKDMFRYLLQENTGVPEALSSWVTEYYGLDIIDASRAFYVLGGDIYGPMGHELIPFSTRQEAEEFMSDHNGRRVLMFNEIDAAILKGLK